jgi:hypothetical protein
MKKRLSVGISTECCSKKSVIEPLTEYSNISNPFGNITTPVCVVGL